MAQMQAINNTSMVATDGNGDEGTMSKPDIVIAYLGGAPPDLGDEDHPDDATVSTHKLQMATPIIELVL